MTSNDAIEDFLSKLFHHNIRLWLDNGRLRCSGPEDALTSKITTTIKERREEIEQFLQQQQTPTEQVLNASNPKHEAIAPLDNTTNKPLSFAQQRLWFIEQMTPGTAMFNMPFAFELRGSLAIDALSTAVEKVIARHEILRTRFVLQNNQAVPQIDAPKPFVIEQGTLNPGEHLQDRIQAIAEHDARSPFKLDSDCLLRIKVLTITPSHHALIICAHHIVADGWSLDIFIKELVLFYRESTLGSPANLNPLPIQYADYAAWQRDCLNNDTQNRLLDFWQQELQAPLPSTQLPTDFPRQAIQTYAGAVHLFHLNKETSQALKHCGQKQSATLFATLLTAFNILLYRYTGQTDLVLGTPAAGRDHSDTEALIGLFVNPLVIRTQLDPEKSFEKNLRAVQNTLWKAQQHQALPFEKLVEILQPERDLSLNPFFQIKCQLDHATPTNDPQQIIELPGLTLRQVPKKTTQAKLDLSLDLVETSEGIAAGFEYNTDLFKPETIVQLAEHFQILLQAIIEKPTEKIAELTLLNKEQQQRQCEQWNDTAKPYDNKVCFHQLVERQAACRPDATALIYDGNLSHEPATHISYKTLNEQANQLAHLLIAKGVKTEHIVGICIDRSPAMVIAMLAVMKAGAAYLPLDPQYPQARIRYMLEDAQVSILLSQSQQTLPTAEHDKPSYECINLDSNQWHHYPTNNPNTAISPDNLAYLIYTSGSTGNPKGVMIAHSGLINLTEDKIRVCNVNTEDCVLQFFSFSFDASIPELVMSLAAGARLLLTSAENVIPGKGLQTLLERHHVTHITITPSALWSLPTSEYQDLKMVLVGGEAPSPELINQWCPNRLFINAYGPTETTVNASMVPCGNEHPLEPTLLPSTNKHLFILDEHLQLLPIGVPGELHISGVGLARGYLNRADLTAERFIPNPFAHPGLDSDYSTQFQTLYKSGDLACYLPNGRIKVLGRLDHQTKVRGYRIELGEIERALQQHPAIKACFIQVREDTPGDKRITAYGVANQTDTNITAADIKQFLRQHLPQFMLPSAFVWLNELPLTPNNKIDTKALPNPAQLQRETLRAPTGETEIKLAAIFSDILNIEQINAQDDFFDLGGHSLLATQLVSQCLNTFGIEVTLLDLFNGPSVEALALTIDHVLQGKDLSKGTALEQQANDHLRQALQADLQLDPAIAIDQQKPFDTQSLITPEAILLTGCTGFIGCYLLRELLQQQCDIFCLVRVDANVLSADETLEMAGHKKIQTAMEQYGIWEPSFSAYIKPIIGDLSQPQLGLSHTIYQHLSETLDVIYHNGAFVHHLLPYEQLKRSNVEGTVEILRLATHQRIKAVHFTSSLSVLPTTPLSGRTQMLESDPLGDYPVPKGTYNRSKWVAEQLISEAAKRGLPVTIHRPGPVSGDSQTGAFNQDDILCQMMQGYIALGMAPRSDIPLDMLPVDYLARLMVYLSRQAENLGMTFHHIHTEPVTSSKLFDACHEAGHSIERVPYQQWHQALLNIAAQDPTHPLYPLVALFASRDVDDDNQEEKSPEAILDLPFDTQQMQQARLSAPFEQPPLDTALFHIYLKALLAGLKDSTRKILVTEIIPD